ncbi:unnamed protein product [Rotaria sp. Silwood2]|nr:unnamed protein product [Rotaria sp. Silwood2]CAF4247518.1 unnamed protein product [Rotaria sp. Silwood2]CAF4400069.1 unnamed protein product [Rotaria sp. Silwood2]
MYYQLTQLLIIGFYIIHFTESSFIYNITHANKILCYSCKGNGCETISNEDDNVIACNRNTQLCWAGFVNHKPYRTCASRYCTPADISLDSDVRIETCCHANLCNSISLPGSIGSERHMKSSAHHSKTSTVSSPVTTTERTTTKSKTTTKAQEIYVVNEIVDNEEKVPSSLNNNEEDDDLKHSQSNSHRSQAVNSVINWEPVHYDKDFSNRVASISKLLILIIPVLLVLIF